MTDDAPVISKHAYWISGDRLTFITWMTETPSTCQVDVWHGSDITIPRRRWWHRLLRLTPKPVQRPADYQLEASPLPSDTRCPTDDQAGDTA